MEFKMMRWQVGTALFCWLMTWPVLWWGGDWKAVWPSLVALTMVFLLRKVILGLLGGAVAGVLLLSEGRPVTAFVAFFRDHTIPSVQGDWRVSVLIFTLLLGGFVGLIEYGGGFRTLFRRLAGDRSHQTRLRVQGGVFGLGIVCFFDGLTNSLLVGRTMRPLADRAGLSREKLSFLVDTTSSAVACVAFVSTWSATQLSLIQEGFAQAGSEVQPYLLFLRSLPYNFYCWFVLLLTVVVITRGWNIGPMRQAEERASRATVEAEVRIDAAGTSVSGGAWQAWVPLLVLLGAVFTGMYVSGAAELWPFGFRKAAEAFGAADAATVLVASVSLACLVAFAVNCRRGATGAGEAFWSGVMTMFAPVVILVCAWILSSTLGKLGAATFLASFLGDQFSIQWLPLGVFLVAMATSFTIGTSWGTMGILMPLALPVTILLLGDGAAADPITAAVVAAVFGGAVFGDHCSPLSDTTIVSSISCGLEPMDHVRTQLPYALLAALVAVVFGYSLLAIGIGPMVSLTAGAAALILLPGFVGKFSGGNGSGEGNSEKTAGREPESVAPLH